MKVLIFLGTVTLIMIPLAIAGYRAKKRYETAEIEEEKLEAYSTYGDVYSIAFLILIALGVYLYIAAGTIVKYNAIVQTQEKRIEILQEGIDEVQEELNLIIDEFLEYEGDTFEKLKPSSKEMLVYKYPELKSNDLAMRKIDILESNRKEIKAAKFVIIEAQEQLLLYRPFYKLD